MPIVAYYIDKVSANKNKPPEGRVDIKSGSKVVSVEKSKTGMINKYDSLAITYEFKTLYEPKLGELVFQGKVVYIGDHVEKGLKMWEKEGKIPDEVEIEVKNFLFRKCLGLGITISENMNLPPPIFFPMVSKKPKGKKIEEEDLRYIG